MISRCMRSLSGLILGKRATSIPWPTPLLASQLVPAPLRAHRELDCFVRSFATKAVPKDVVVRDVEAFTPVLNDFIAKYPMTSDKMDTIKDLRQKCERYGFTALDKTASSLMKESSAENAIDFYSTLVIATIQVKDLTLLRYVLEDADRYIELNSRSVYEVLRRICHFRQYSQFLAFLDSFLSSHPDSRSDPQLLQMALYLCHKDDSVSVEQVLRYWDHLRSVPVATEEEKQQRRMDLEHVLHVFIRAGDWRQCSSLLDDANCTARHVSLYLRGLARTRDLRRMVSVYLDHGSLVYSGDASSAVQEKHFIVNLLLDVAKLTRDSTLGEVVIGDVLRHATVGSRDFSFPLTSAIYARMARLSIAHGLTSCVYRLYVLGDPRSREMPKVLRSMERYMASVDSTDPEILRMKEEVSRLHLSNPLDGEAAGETRSEQEKTSGLVFDEDEFIEEDVLQILKDDFNVKRVTRNRKKYNRKPKKKGT